MDPVENLAVVAEFRDKIVKPGNLVSRASMMESPFKSAQPF
jgi:hypothetical protein